VKIQKKTLKRKKRDKNFKKGKNVFTFMAETAISRTRGVKLARTLFNLLCGFVVQQAVQQIHNKIHSKSNKQSSTSE